MSDAAKVISALEGRSSWRRFPFSMIALGLGLVLAVISVAGCGQIPAWPNDVTEATLRAAQTSAIPAGEGDLGAELYAEHCAGCHGRSAEGLSSIAAMSEAEIFNVTSEGDQQGGMPAYGNTLSSVEITALVTHMRELTGSDTVSDSAASSAVLTLQAEASDDGKAVTLIAVLTDQAGNPIVGAPIDFAAQALFGDLSVGSVTTGADGIATLSYELSGAHLDSWAASYGGDSMFGSSAAETQAGLAPIEAPASPSGSLITSYPPLLPTLVVVAALGSVWVVFGYVIYQLLAIRRGERSHRQFVTSRRKLS